MGTGKIASEPPVFYKRTQSPSTPLPGYIGTSVTLTPKFADSQSCQTCAAQVEPMVEITVFLECAQSQIFKRPNPPYKADHFFDLPTCFHGPTQTRPMVEGRENYFTPHIFSRKCVYE